ncbi:MAG: TetR/AcrR family transcriptional regulator C-terminal domain-containing protein [Rhizobiales bacterium]|nr:TetR/AcrR family transcriptional regulator C-terminal domain-containing protein [Hyphomicrobiales bacterium]
MGLSENKPALEILQDFGPKLLTLLLSPRAIALNRAAAGDSSGILGKTLAKHGRETIFPLLVGIFDRVCKEKMIKTSPTKLAEIYIRLLVGDLQIRRVIGAMDEFTPKEIKQRSIEAINIIMLNESIDF